MSFNTFFFSRRKYGVLRGRSTSPLLRFFAFLIVIVPLVISAAAGAKDITYTGDGDDLRVSPSWLPRESHLAVLPEMDGVFLPSGNNVTVSYDADVSGMTNTHYVIGGLSESENATDNTITFIDGKAEGYIYGGATRYGNAERNTVTIISGEVVGDVNGGYSKSGANAYGNSVFISGGKIGGDVFGGLCDVGNSDYNTVTISGGSVIGDVYGGASDAYSADNKTVTFNTITVNGGEIGGDACGGYSKYGNVAYNTVIVRGGEVGGDVNGGAGLVIDNVNYNTVAISGGSINGNVYGGQSIYSGNAEYNTVTISGGSVIGNVYGGYAEGDGAATNNTVTIDGSPVFSANSYIYGGYVAGSGNNFTGNTLNVKNSGVSVKGVDNFEYYNFYLPQGISENDAMLTVKDSVDLNGTTINIYLQDNLALEAGSIITLIDCGERIINVKESDTSQASQGAFITHDFNLYVDITTNNLLAELLSTNYSADNKALTNSRLAPLALINQGADMAASLEHMEVSGDKQLTAFAVFGGGSSTYSTGSDVDIDSFSLLAGVAWNAPVKKNSLTLSAFIEAGWGSYDTTNDFSGSVVRGEGNTDYYGAGLHMRYKWDNGKPGGLYAEGSLRYGRVTTKFDTNDLKSEPAFHYDSGGNYYGAHAGLGYVWQLSDKTCLDVSGKYLWTHLDSDETTSTSGDRISFDSADSHRLRAGFRFYYDYGNAVTLYYGAAYEYEFDGDAGGRLYGTYALDGSSLSGGSGIGELGVMFRPSKDNDRLMMQLGVQGYVGVREGISGTLKLQYAF